jgi:glycosyltransferase involved in cell wall biosynthesis
VFAVSRWVLAGLRDIGAPAWPEPLLGVADLRSHGEGRIVMRPRYDFDERKLRDRVLGVMDPLLFRLRPRRTFSRQPGLTLGIVSRITPIKQFPLLFRLLAPWISEHAGIHLEIFGAGGYASVRDLTQALRPVRDRVRFWGHQSDVATVYGTLDYLLTGLPEKEALGLNVIEAESAGVPVLAVAAPPFTETVIDGKTGFLYRDPREDAGADFGRLLERLIGGERCPDPRAATEHLTQFSMPAFTTRVARVLPAVAKDLAQ